MQTYGFLTGGGEMGERTRNFDWTKTSLGSPDHWPRSLRSTVATILASRFPMFLWWGPEMIQFYNDAYRPSLGDDGKHPNALGQKGKDCWPEIWDIIYPLISQVLNTGEATWSEDQLVPIYRNGAIEDVYWTFGYSPVRDDEDNIYGVLVICTETTQKVKALREIEQVVAERTKTLAERTDALAEAIKNLERSNAELTQFAHIASHDLQEPIRKVITYAGMLQDSSVHTGAHTENFINKIITASQRMQVLIRDILTYSELSRQSPIFEPVDLRTVVEEAEVEFELLIEQKCARLQYDGLPTIDAIPLQMTQLFTNLLSNALKYSSPHRPPVITITSATQGQQAHIQIRDNGIGFDQQYAGHIFSIFQRLHRKTEYSGTGIGLAMCKRIAQNHQGDITATSDPGHGATFHITLPLHHPASVGKTPGFN